MVLFCGAYLREVCHVDCVGHCCRPHLHFCDRRQPQPITCFQSQHSLLQPSFSASWLATEHASTCRIRGEGGPDFRKPSQSQSSLTMRTGRRVRWVEQRSITVHNGQPLWLEIIAFAEVDRGAISALSFALFPHQAHSFSRRAARSSISTALCRAVFRALSPQTAWSFRPYQTLIAGRRVSSSRSIQSRSWTIIAFDPGQRCINRPKIQR
jgi:hypothetical protein